MSLYTKYRPRDWDSVIWQDMISTILRNSLKMDRVGHAYIFTGSRWTGKTTSARILAKWVNCTNLQNGNPCHECKNCRAFDNGGILDIIEIDGASNNSVDDVRDLIEKARYEPTQGRYKIYIIDEVHMLSGGAFNALLKTIEEPPPHVKFILATTEIEKVPETIRSRSLRFDFRKITEVDIIKRLQFVSEEEWIKVEDEVLKIIAKAARWAMRDALTLLEQNTINGEVSTEYVRSTLALLEESLIEEIITNIYKKNVGRILEILEVLQERHVQVRGFFDQILYALRDKLFASLDTTDFAIYEEIFGIFESAYTRIKWIPDGMLLIEITLIRAVKRNEVWNEKSEVIRNEAKKIWWNARDKETEGDKLFESESKQEKRRATAHEFLSPSGPFGTFQVWKVEKKDGTKSTEIGVWKTTGKDSPNENGKKIETNEVNSQPTTTSPFSYATLLRALKEKKPALSVDLKTARYEIEWTKLILIFSKDWNFSRVNTANVKNIITEALETSFASNWIVECRLEGKVWGDISEGIF